MFALTPVLMSVLATLQGVVRSHMALHLEVLALRHQLHLLQRSQPRRLHLATTDRWRWAWLSRAWSGWRTALVIVKPEPVVAWHRQLEHHHTSHRGVGHSEVSERPRSDLRAAVDDALRSMVVTMLKTPVRAPQANAHCERFIGTARREYLDWIIPLHERHLRRILAEWIPHYNRERPHEALGPGFPDGPADAPRPTGHRLPLALRVGARARLGGLHHDYRLDSVAA